LRQETFMNPVAKALWFIESHFAGEVTLAEAAISGIFQTFVNRVNFKPIKVASLERRIALPEVPPYAWV
jgi:hypothetical protein